MPYRDSAKKSDRMARGTSTVVQDARGHAVVRATRAGFATAKPAMMLT
jgi:hypothetical protein